MEPPSFLGSSRQAKAPSNNTQVAHCLVDGCCADLSLCRDYHRRHKVCEAHSKTPKVTIGGREQRFCQQCSRFHSLVDFDEGKRSCRKRLAGHNRRRRKPQPDCLPRNPELVFSMQPGGVSGATHLSFTTPKAGRPSTINLHGSSTLSWGDIVKSGNEMVVYSNQHLINFIDGQPNSLPESSGVINQLHDIRDDVMLGSSSSDPALSLLSSAPITTREFRSNHAVVQIEPPLPLSQSHPLDYGGGLGQYPFAHESKPMIDTTAAASDSHGGNNSAALHLQELFQLRNEGSSTSGSHRMLTFSWE